MNFEFLLSKYKLSTLELGTQKCFVIELFKIKNYLAPYTFEILYCHMMFIIILDKIQTL